MKSAIFSQAITLALPAWFLSVAATSTPACKEVTFTVSGSATNRDVSNAPLNNITLLTQAIKLDLFPRINVSGTQTIAGWYCPPAVVNANNAKLQFFLSSITNNREAFTAQGGTLITNPPLAPYQPEIYSWVQYASKLGYATLTLDKLGTGRSSHPDPILVVQAPYEITLYHDLVTQIKAGKTGQLPSAYSNLIYVGNSYGSELGASIAGVYPNDFTNFILTGFSKLILPSLPGVSAQGPLPASQVDPARFGNLPPGYLTSPNETTRTNSFFGDPKYVDFDPQNSHLFFTRKDVVSVGQFISAYIGNVPAPAYKGRVLVITGEQDQAFCGPGSSAIDPNPSCGPLLKDTQVLFPNANYSYKSIPRSGHALILHKSAPLTLKVSHDFLAGKTFAG